MPAVSVLLVDDSAATRGLLAKALSAHPGIAIAGSASNGSTAIIMARELKPDVIILDIEMPVMDGITALPEILKVSPASRVIIASTLTAHNADISLKALALGATDCLAKPSANADEAAAFYRELAEKILMLGAPADKPHAGTVAALAAGERLNPDGVTALAIASSTGGPQALMALFGELDGHLTGIPIFITQHMPPVFTTFLAEHLSAAGNRNCAEAQNGQTVLPGHCYIAPGGYHMLAEKQADGRVGLRITQDAQENFCRPSADPMLRSLSQIYGSRLALLVLTGMGQDGLEGAKHVVRAGGSVIAQDEATSIIYGMPRAVAAHGLCKAVLPLPAIGRFLIRQIDGGGA